MAKKKEVEKIEKIAEKIFRENHGLTLISDKQYTLMGWLIRSLIVKAYLLGEIKATEKELIQTKEETKTLKKE